jgi:PAS domain S-box-containing protein
MSELGKPRAEAAGTGQGPASLEGLAQTGSRVVELERELDSLRAERDALLSSVQARARLEATIDAAPLAIMSVSAVHARYVFANRAYANLLGRSQAELLASDPYQIWVTVTHPDDVEAEREALDRIAKGEIASYQLDKRLVHRSGEARWVRAEIVASRDAKGRLEYLTGYFTDIHEQRGVASAREHLEAQLRQAQKLEALGKLAGGVAHDFNNRLVIIMGYTELLKRGLPADSPLEHHTDMVLNSAQRAAELTRQLLAYSRRQVLKPEAFALDQAVDRLRPMLERLLGDRIELSTRLSATFLAFSDPGQIEQVILNLAINARDAMPQGGKLVIETRDVRFAAGEEPPLAEGDYVALVVSDNGTGISDQVLPQIFEPFFTTKELGKGTGLGLSMVEGIVHQSGGAIKVATRLGVGTTFSVFLPRAKTDASALRYSAEPVPAREMRFETVLVCDDDDDVRKLLADVIGFRSYQVLQARNGRQALELASAHDGPIQLLVTDLVMPELGGLELAAELRRRYPALHVLYVSGYSDNADSLSEPLGPKTQFLAKPFVPGDLTRAVAALLDEEATVGESDAR